MFRVIVDWILCALVFCSSWCLCNWAAVIGVFTAFAVVGGFTTSLYVFAGASIFDVFLVVCMASRLIMLALSC